MNYKEVNIGTRVGFVCGFVALLFILVNGGCNKAPQPDVHNRVPTIPQSTADAQRAASDAQAAAASAQAALKEMQAKPTPAPEPKVEYNSEGTPQEHTNVGHVTDVTEIWEPKADETQYGEAYIAFTFVENGGFAKRFYPVCSDQVIQTGSPTSIMFHWSPNRNSYKHNEKGCYKIDGYIQKGQ